MVREVTRAVSRSWRGARDQVTGKAMESGFYNLVSSCKKNAQKGLHLQTQLWKHAEVFWREGSVAGSEAGTGMGEFEHGRDCGGRVAGAAGRR